MASFFKDAETKKWNVQYMCVKPDGSRGKKTKRGFKKRADAVTWYTENASQIESGAVIDDALTVKKWLDIYRETYQMGREKSTKTAAEIYFRHFCEHIGSVKLRSLRPDQVQNTVNALSEKFKASTIKTMFSVFHTAVRRALNDDLIRKDPCAYIILPKQEFKRPATCESNDIVKVLEQARKSRFYIPILLCATLGLRRGESLGLKWSDITGSTIHVHMQIDQRGNYKRLKTDGSQRTLSIPATLDAELKAHKKRQLADKIRCGAMYQDEDFICATAGGGVLSPNALTHAARAFMADLGLPKGTSLHTLRHSYGTLMVHGGVPLDVVSELLGHTSITTTHKYYIGSDDEKKKQAADLASELFKAK